MRKFFANGRGSVPLKRLARRLLGTNAVTPCDAKLSYAQEGEDLLLLRLLEDRTLKTGFYIDVGAHHPTRFSNTKVFYDLGWHGINIEANPDAAAAFRSERQRDINICAAVGGNRGMLTYFMFDDPALNGFDESLSAARVANSAYKIVDERQIEVKPLGELLDEVLMHPTAIDFLTVDVEGMDAEVLSSNDWNRHRPKFVLAEIYATTFEEVARSAVYGVMHAAEYELISKARYTCIFRDMQNL